MTTVIPFPGKFYGDQPAEVVLTALAEQKPNKVFVICWPEDGSMPTYHTNTSDVPVIVFRLQQFLHDLYNGEFCDLDGET